MIPRASIPISLAALVLALLGAGASIDAEGEIDPGKVAAVKAAYLYRLANFESRFVRWPAHVWDGPTAPVTVGVLGRDPLGAHLDRAFADKVIDGHPTRIWRQPTLPDEAVDPEQHATIGTNLRKCHVLFVCASEKERLNAIIEELDDAPVLTVSDIEGFAAFGGMIEFVLVEDSVRFDINRAAAVQAKLNLHPNLLRVARRVHDDPAKERRP